MPQNSKNLFCIRENLQPNFCQMLLQLFSDTVLLIHSDKTVDSLKIIPTKGLTEKWNNFKHSTLSEIFPSELVTKISELIEKTFNSQNIEMLEYSVQIDNSLKFFELQTLSFSKTEMLMKIRDISHQKNIEMQNFSYEKKLHETQNRATESEHLKTAFLANMSHEIRTPVNSILGFADLLRRPNLSPEKREQYINTIHRNGHTLINLIDDILDISKIEAGQVSLTETECSLNGILLDMYNFYSQDLIAKNKANIELRWVKDKNIKHSILIFVDMFRLQQVLKNLLSNAIKFTDEGIIEFGYKFSDEKTLLFFVKDSGIGMSKEKQKIIFDRFVQADNTTTRKYGGTGLGLAISKRIIELWNGKISVESEVEQGAFFQFTLPYKPVTEKSKTKKINIFQREWEKYSILIAEDDDSNFQLLSEMLIDTKVKILRAKTGKEAVEITTNSLISLILMDVQMPEMNGFAATEIIKKSQKIPIILQTASVLPQHKSQGFEIGADEFISKPIEIDELFEILEKYLEK